MTRIGFLVLYLLAMLPTYVLPFLGSNSVILQGVLAAETGGSIGLAWTALHVGALAMLTYLAWARGSVNGRQFLVALPIVAGVFDIVPILSSIPLVPTVLHIITVLIGFDAKHEVEDTDDLPAAAVHPLLCLSGIAIAASLVAVAIVATQPVTARTKAGQAGQAAPQPSAPALASPSSPSPSEAPSTQAPAIHVASVANWTYDESMDDMRGERKVFALTKSVNEVQLQSPYNSPQRLHLLVRRVDNRKGSSEFDVIVSIPKGIIQCHTTDCRLTAKFDDAEPETWTGSGPESDDSNLVFVSNTTRFIERLKSSKRLIIEVPFFSHGREQFKFELQPLELPAKQ